MSHPPFTNPLDEALVPSDDADWRGWYKSINTQADEAGTTVAVQIVVQIKAHTDKSFAQRVPPHQVIWYGHRTAALLAKKLKYSQLRRYVNDLKAISEIQDWEARIDRLNLFRLQLVHGYSRKPALEPFYTLLSGILGIGTDALFKAQRDFDRFMSLIDAITAYFEILDDKSNND